MRRHNAGRDRTLRTWKKLSVLPTAAFEFDLESEKLAQSAETAAATAAAAIAHGDPAAAAAAKRAMASEIALVRQRVWEEIQVGFQLVSVFLNFFLEPL